MLTYAAETVLTDNFKMIKATANQQIEEAGLKTEYFEIIDGYTLLPVKSAAESDYIVAVVASWAGDVRLIDNAILLKRDDK